MGATGPKDPQGNAGTDGTTITSAPVSGGALTPTLSDSNTINVTGSVAGAQGNAGVDGTDGVGITSVSLVGGANLVLNYSNSSTQDVGNIKGPKEQQEPRCSKVPDLMM